MPQISQFYGIAIYMYFEDHAPPHIHARYAGAEAVIAIADGGAVAARRTRAQLDARVGAGAA